MDTRGFEKEGFVIVFCVKLGSGCGALAYWRGRVNLGRVVEIICISAPPIFISLSRDVEE